MKKVLLLIFSFVCLFAAPAVWAYQTVLVDFPDNQGWHADYYDTQAGETILQYVPAGQTSTNWTRTLIFHSYKNLTWTDSAAKFMDRIIQQMELKNPSRQYRYLKYTDTDSIATRCVKKNANTPSQCEIFRATKSFESMISMHYINKNNKDFTNTYPTWYGIIRDVRVYYNYYREDRILDKATSFEI